jgi:O-antigen ligase
MTLSHGSYQENRLSFGSTYDPNDLAYMFVSLLPFTVFYISDSKNLITKLFAALTMIISSMLILFSGSRGGLIGFAIMLLLFLFSKLSPIRRSIKLALIIMILVFAVTNKDILFTGRYTTLMEVDQDYNVTDEYGRINLWKKAGEFIVKRPLTGVGALCFPNAIGFERRSRLGQERWQAVHNSYLQIASELGLIAFTIFILMIKESLRVLQKVRRSESKMINMTGIQNLAGIVQIGFICHLFVALFLTQGYSIIFTLFFAFATAFNKLLNQV